MLILTLSLSLTFKKKKKKQSIFEYMDAMMEGKMQFLLCAGWQKEKFLHEELFTAKAD